MEEVGPRFVKLGQILATRVDLFPPEWIAEFSRLQNAVPPVPFEAIRTEITEALGAAPESAFLWLDPEPLAAAKPGYHANPDSEDFFCVVTTKDGKRTYAKKLVMHGNRATWEYAPGVGRELAASQPMDLEDAKFFGHLHGICFVCGRQLTVPAHALEGIGPVCSKRFA